MTDFIDIKVTENALPKVCEVLCRDGITDACVSMEGGEIHVRWKNRSAGKGGDGRSCAIPSSANPVPGPLYGTIDEDYIIRQ